MSETRGTRREIVMLAAGSAAAASILGASAIPAEAYQGNMHRAIEQLRAARASLQEATPNKGGHRENAIGLIDQAISEVRAGIEFANEH